MVISLRVLALTRRGTREVPKVGEVLFLDLDAHSMGVCMMCKGNQTATHYLCTFLMEIILQSILLKEANFSPALVEMVISFKLTRSEPIMF